MLVRFARVAACFAFALVALIAPRGARAADRYQQLAQHVVVDVLGAKSGDVVLITSSSQNADLIADFMVALRSVGAWPITNTISDKANRDYFNEVAPQYDSQEPIAALRLASIIAAQINIDYEQNPKLFQGVPPARLNAQAQAFTPVTKYFVDHQIPYIEIGNGLYPSKYTAQQYAISTTQLSDAFWNGVNVDYGSLREDATAVQQRVASGNSVHVTAGNGTDLVFNIRGTKIIVAAGQIPPPSQRRSGAAVYTGLPAGEVIFSPVPSSASGVVIFDPVFVNGTEVDGMRLVFTNGHMTSMTAKTGLAAVQAFYDTATPGKDQLSFADFGVNRKVKWIQNSKMFASMAAGMLSLGVGGDIALGGSNTSNFNFNGYLANASVSIDNKPLIVNGQLVSLSGH